jgi:hypothetical protein
MTALDRWFIGMIITAGLLIGGWVGVLAYGAHQYHTGHAAGYAAAVDAGRAQHDRDAAAAAKTESDLRQALAEKDTQAHQKEIEHAQALADAQRRVRTGVDRLRCPAASPVQPSAAPATGPASAAPATDGAGPDLMPEAASDILGYGAAIAGLVSRYSEVAERYDTCRAVNAK